MGNPYSPPSVYAAKHERQFVVASQKAESGNFAALSSAVITTSGRHDSISAFASSAAAFRFLFAFLALCIHVVLMDLAFPQRLPQPAFHAIRPGVTLVVGRHEERTLQIQAAAGATKQKTIPRRDEILDRGMEIPGRVCRSLCR